MENCKDVENFVKAVLAGKNVKASKLLEKTILSKCEKKIKDTLNN